LKTGKNENGSADLIRRYANLGIELVVAVLLGAWGGYQLDQWFGTTPWLLLLGFFFGTVAGFLNLTRLIASEKGGKKKE